MKDGGLISSIESYTVHDGPGCRTTLFFAGCPLKCQWCANPETWDLKLKILFTGSKCQSGCRRCVNVCHNKAVSRSDGGLSIDWEKCGTCGDFACADICHTEALRVCGSWYTEKQLLERINRDRNYWDAGGGVTFSGGEPLFQHQFLKKILEKCRELYIHTAIETTAHAGTDIFLDIFSMIDFAFIDIKHMDPILHREKTGVENAIILKNIKALAGSGWPGRLVLRTPIIEDFNDSPENMTATAGFMSSIGLREINLLPFHRLGDSKWQQLGKSYRYSSFQATDADRMLELQEIFENAGLICYIGSDTSF
jgi:pyruvate formate lyase activating enzyme